MLLAIFPTTAIMISVLMFARMVIVAPECLHPIEKTGLNVLLLIVGSAAGATMVTIWMRV